MLLVCILNRVLTRRRHADDDSGGGLAHPSFGALRSRDLTWQPIAGEETVKLESTAMTIALTGVPGLRREPERRWLVKPSRMEDVLTRANGTSFIAQARWWLNPRIAATAGQLNLETAPETEALKVALDTALNQSVDRPYVRLRHLTTPDGVVHTYVAVKAGHGHNQVEFEGKVSGNTGKLASLRPDETSYKIRHHLSLRTLFNPVTTVAGVRSFDVACDVFQLPARTKLNVQAAADTTLTLPRGPVAVLEVEQTDQATEPEVAAVSALLDRETVNNDSVLQVELTPFRGIVRQLAAAAAQTRELA